MTSDRDMFGARPGEYEVTSHAQLGICRSCGATVVWIQTPKRRFMPLSIATIETRDGKRYALSHFVDCPHAKEWSNKK